MPQKRCFSVIVEVSTQHNGTNRQWLLLFIISVVWCRLLLCGRESWFCVKKKRKNYLRLQNLNDKHEYLKENAHPIKSQISPKVTIIYQRLIKTLKSKQKLANFQRPKIIPKSRSQNKSIQLANFNIDWGYLLSWLSPLLLSLLSPLSSLFLSLLPSLLMVINFSLCITA